MPALRETWVLSLGWEDPLEKGMALHSNILAWKIPLSMRSQRVGHDWAICTFTLWSSLWKKFVTTDSIFLIDLSLYRVFHFSWMSKKNDSCYLLVRVSKFCLIILLIHIESPFFVIILDVHQLFWFFSKTRPLI